MKKSIRFLFLISLALLGSPSLCVPLSAQSIIEPTYEITYDFKYIRDTVAETFVRPEAFRLIRYGEEARFHAESRQYNDSMYMEFNLANPQFVNPTEQEDVQAAFDALGAYQRQHKKPEYAILKIKKDFTAQRGMIERLFSFPPQHLEESLDFDWQLTNAQDTIAGLLCYQATTTYGGRHYTAWYAPEVPISDGPYVFCGLPGLIVQIADEREWFQFRLKNIQTNPGPRFWSKDYFNPSSQAIDRKTYVDKSVEQKNNPRLIGIIDATEEMLLKAKKRNSWRYFMLLEWY